MNNKQKLLTRDEFREGVFERDNHKCVICGAPKQDAHHILERRLFSDGGYYLDNGATLCEDCHIKAETTEISCDEIREKAGIIQIILPDDYYPDHKYTKWGDIILDNGMRMKGPFFNDESVQKILSHGGKLQDYTDYIKYPRTMHLPWSEGQTEDDRTLANCDHFVGKEVVVLEKMDGENSNIYRNGYHARSVDGRNHWSRSYIKNMQARIGYEIPEGWRICAENLYAKHSIYYDNLESYVLGFGIWNERNICLGWDETVAYFDILDIKYPSVFYRGVWDEKLIKELYSKYNRNKVEGYVVRLADSFSYSQFRWSVAKFVRKEHVNTSHHWFFNSVETNKLKQ